MTGKHSIDGFVPRRPGDQLGGGEREAKKAPTGLSRPEIPRQEIKSVKAQTTNLGIARADISDSLKEIDSLDGNDKGKKKNRRKKGKDKRSSKKRRIIKWSIIAVVLIILGIGAWILYKGLLATGNIFQGNILDIVQNQPLKQDENGRSNILLLGTSEDDPGHEGATLTDSMMIVSVNQEEKIVDMFSIPRDFYVEYGMACNSGYEGKINEYFNCVNSDWNSEAAEEERITKSREFIGEIFGLDIQYGVHVNNTVIKEAVDAVGGIDVDIQGSNGDPGILDRNFDWRCNYECYFVRYDNGVHHLNGEHALFLTMARGSVAPTYGLGNSNFDREINQQKVILALQAKAISTGTLTDIGKVTRLIDTLGSNLRTNFATSEIRTLMQLGHDIKPENIKTINLFEGDEAVVKSGDVGGASAVLPTAGLFNYGQIRTFINSKLRANAVTRDEANVAIFNGAGVTGLAQREADDLTEKGFIVSEIGDAPEGGNYVDVEIYQIGGGKTVTKDKLKSLFGVEIRTTTPPVTAAEGTNFVIIFGKDLSADTGQ